MNNLLFRYGVVDVLTQLLTYVSAFAVRTSALSRNKTFIHKIEICGAAKTTTINGKHIKILKVTL